MDRFTIDRKEGNFVMIYKDPFKDNDLSLKAKGLIATVMAFPPNWDFSIGGLAGMLKEGKSAIYSAIDELISCGYCKRDYLYDNGKRVGVNYSFADYRKFNAEDDKSLNSENLNLGNQDLENQPQYNIEKNKISTESNTLSKHKEKEPKVKFADFVSMTNAEYEKLSAELGESGAKECVDILNNYKGSKGKTYKSDYLAIHSWVIDKYKEKKAKALSPQFRQSPLPQNNSLPKWKAMGFSSQEEYLKAFGK